MHKCKLEAVLNNNPFTPSLIKKWREDIMLFEEESKSLDELSFILPEDDMQDIRKNGDDGKLHLEVLPQPFLGDPNAPIWILLLNPGYHAIDRYDHLGYCPLCKKICSSDKSMLYRRQKLLLDQLLFKNQRFFPAFDESFKESYVLLDSKNHGIYGWYRKSFFGSNKSSNFIMDENCGKVCSEVGSKIFVLECFPYHSKSFSMSLIKKSKYYNFWRNLVSWAADNKKYFILRSEKIRQVLLESNINLPNDRVVKIKNCRNVALTEDNLISDELNTLNDVLRILKS